MNKVVSFFGSKKSIITVSFDGSNIVSTGRGP